MPRKKSEETVNAGTSPYTILMRWVNDGNLKSPFPAELNKNGIISPYYILMYFESSADYFPFINKIYNKYSLFYLSTEDLMRTFKEIVYFTGYRHYNARYPSNKENELIKKLWKKYPYLKKEEICMLVDWIDKSDKKETIYDMFNLNNKLKVKKMTKSEIKERKKTIDGMVSSTEIMDMI